jgi:hypothetical protein
MMETKKKPVKTWGEAFDEVAEDFICSIPVFCAVAVALVILSLVLYSNATFECTNYMECIP